MKNCIYIIYGKTIDGRDIALDGYKVESFANYHCDRQGIMEIVFRSGQTARMAEDDDLQSKLVESMQVDKKTIDAPNPHSLVDYYTTGGFWGLFDGNATECIISHKCDGKEYLELHFDSGKTLTVFADSLEGSGDVTEEEISNLVDDYIYRHKK